MAKTEIKYLRIPNWDKYQERRQNPAGATWKPPWFKVYTKIDYKFSELSLRQRGLLVELWKLAAQLDNEIPYSEAWISRAAMLTENVNNDLEKLISSGFVSHYVKTTERLPKDYVTEESRGEKKEANASSSEEVEEIFQHWKNARSKERARFTDTRKVKVKARLKSFSAIELIRAIDAVALDPWEDRSRHDDLAIILRSDEQVEKFLALADDPAVYSPEERRQRHLEDLRERGVA